MSEDDIPGCMDEHFQFEYQDTSNQRIYICLILSNIERETKIFLMNDVVKSCNSKSNHYMSKLNYGEPCMVLETIKRKFYTLKKTN